MIEITLNNQPYYIEENSTISTIFQKKHITLVAIWLNGRHLRREEYDTIILQKEDVVEIVRLTGGG